MGNSSQHTPPTKKYNKIRQPNIKNPAKRGLPSDSSNVNLNLPLTMFSILVVFHFGRLPFWSSSILVVFQFGRLQFWSSSILVVFHFGRLPFRSSSILVIHI